MFVTAARVGMPPAPERRCTGKSDPLRSLIPDRSAQASPPPGTMGSGTAWPMHPLNLIVLVTLMGGMARAMCRDRRLRVGCKMKHGGVMRPWQPSARRRPGRCCCAKMQTIRRTGPGSVESDTKPKAAGPRGILPEWTGTTSGAGGYPGALHLAAQAAMQTRQVRFRLPADRILREVERDFELLRALRERSRRAAVRLSRRTTVPMECEEGVMAFPTAMGFSAAQVEHGTKLPTGPHLDRTVEAKGDMGVTHEASHGDISALVAATKGAADECPGGCVRVLSRSGVEGTSRTRGDGQRGRRMSTAHCGATNGRRLRLGQAVVMLPTRAHEWSGSCGRSAF